MAYATIEAMLERVQETRHQIKNLLLAANHCEQDEVLAALLRRLSAHDQRQEDLQSGHCDSASPGVLSTWIQYPGLDDLEPIIAETRRLRDSHCTDTELLVDLTLRFQAAVLNVYHAIQRQSGSPRVREFSQQLIDMTGGPSRQKSRDRIELHELGAL